MKKKTSIIFLLVPLILFSIVYFNLVNLNQTMDNLIEYIFYWFVTLFALSLLAFKLENIKYRNWLVISLIITCISVFLAYKNDLVGNAVADFDGELTTIWLVGLYSFVSIIYFIVNFLKNRNG